LTAGEIGVWSVSSLFFDVGESVCKCMCVYSHTHTHTLHMGYSDVSPRVGTRHLEGPTNPDGLHLGIYSYMCTKYTCQETG